MWPFGGRFFPGTNLQDLNLDWIVQRVRDLSRGIIAPFINTANKHWMVWDTDAETFVDSGVSAAGEGTGPQGEPGKSPVIGSNGNWYTWDQETDVYTDTGIAAQGQTGPEGPAGPRAGNNLLDNWYFVGGGSQLGNGVFPINQRGQTVYEGAVYGIDRWRVTGGGTVTLPNDKRCVVFNSGNGNYNKRFIQGLGAPLNPGKYTLSVMLKINSITGSASLRLNEGSSVVPGGAKSIPAIVGEAQVVENAIEVSAVINNPTIEILIPTTGDVSIDIFAFKLELGSAQTLAHQENGEWVLNELPDYGEELLSCQRYLLKIGPDGFYVGNSGANSQAPTFFIPTPVSMSGRPTVTPSTAVFNFQHLSGYSNNITLSNMVCALEETGIRINAVSDTPIGTTEYGMITAQLNYQTNPVIFLSV